VTNEHMLRAHGKFWAKVRSALFLAPALFAPHKRLRVLFHRLRGVVVGRNVEIGYACLLGGVCPGAIHLEDNVVVAARCIILEHDNAYYYTFGGAPVCADVYVREGSFIGVGSVLCPGVEIGPRAVIGALSLVKSSIPPFCVAVGHPARVVKKITNGQALTCGTGSASHIPDTDKTVVFQSG